MLQFDTIRYMGNKSRLLDYIIPAIKSVTPENGIVCDIMSGSNVVSYALKDTFTVYSNDIQEYSYVISKAVIVNQTETITAASAMKELKGNIEDNERKKHFAFFEKTYANTYFSLKQCCDIDSIRYAISKIQNTYRQSLYLLALMNAMCVVQSTPGHFAQFMPSKHKRIIPLQKMDLRKEFLKKCNLYSYIYFSSCDNKAFCMDYKKLLEDGFIDEVNTIYLDSPYSQEQYSRFYHILETLVKYDNPVVNYKAKYRDDRFMSGFCYKTKVAEEFRTIIEFCKNKSINLVISYSNHAVLPIEELKNLCKEYFRNVEFEKIKYEHSTQGKGNKQITEFIITCSI
ncbi:MAG: DNA adenine methylase [Clostridia bacterium]|nr:DNA adenine methylase [Clostridia bacterium]